MGCDPWEIFENIGAYLCNLVHFEGEIYNIQRTV